MDHVSDSFIETIAPILVLSEAAKAGNEREVEEYSGIFQDHASKLIEVSQLFLLSNFSQLIFNHHTFLIFSH